MQSVAECPDGSVVGVFAVGAGPGGQELVYAGWCEGAGLGERCQQVPVELDSSSGSSLAAGLEKEC